MRCPPVHATFVQYLIDLVAQRVRLGGRQRALEIADYDPQQHVLLRQSDAEPFARSGGQVCVARLADDLDCLDRCAPAAERLARAIAEFLGCRVLGDRNGQIAAYWRLCRHGSIRLQIEHLRGNPRIGGAQCSP